MVSKILDFGFSIVDEKELRQYEEQLKDEVKLKQEDVEVLKAKLETLYEMIMTLLKGMTAQPEKHYIFWPSRVEKINAFINEINSVVKR